MKATKVFTVVPVVCALLTGCTWDSPLSSLWSSHSSHSILSTKSNGEIIQELITLNQAEVAAADVALKNSKNAKIKHYARHLKEDHLKCLHKVEHFSHETGIKPVMNPVATHMKHHEQDELTQLKSLHGKAFDKAFLMDMIEDHKAALQVLDEAMVQSTNEKLTKALKGAHHHVEMHLHRAEHLQKELSLS